jgi:hypothetical protein
MHPTFAILKVQVLPSLHRVTQKLNIRRARIRAIWNPLPAVGISVVGGVPIVFLVAYYD